MFLSKILLKSSDTRVISGGLNEQYLSSLTRELNQRMMWLEMEPISLPSELDALSFEIHDINDSLTDSLNASQAFYTKINHRYWELLFLSLQGRPSFSNTSRLPANEFTANGFTKALRDLFFLTLNISTNQLVVLPTGVSLRIGSRSIYDDFNAILEQSTKYPIDISKRYAISGLDAFTSELSNSVKSRIGLSDTFDFYNLYISGQIQKIILERASSASNVVIIKDRSQRNPCLIGISPSKHTYLYVPSRDVNYDWMHSLSYVSNYLLRELRLGKSLVVLVRAGVFSALLGKYIALQCHLLSIKSSILFIDMGNLLEPSDQKLGAVNLEFFECMGYSRHRDSPLVPSLFTYSIS